ncbi:Diaminohydroxyphosphoribosylaminopyrimidine deaminase / 5-amino-6-(5-phosphoribosylamino)uracil reductase [hydrothermal vent metagenome]|uniref:5-amino-6-(5-phosphoribosylamino)uracil reductase n=1 Tax=hydrothermal vent metagenome TaxID=652676 RepID=A0A1W1BAB8_9ZZZZ
MSLAISKAWEYQVLTAPNPAVGACVVSPCGKILSVEAHKRAGFPHAEVEALKSAYIQLTSDTTIASLTSSQDIHTYLLEHHNGCFIGCEIYTTLEPCAHYGKTPSCASLITSLGLSKVYIGASDFNNEAAGGAVMLKENGIEVEEGILSQKCDDLLLPFRHYLQRNFVFFKWAQRLDGSTNDGAISSSASKELVHKMRDVCDLLVIGGNTVRVDRPTLDARVVSGKAPDILIYSREKEFDPSIPLFSVPDRKVYIEDSLERIKEYRCVMIEGSERMFEATKDYTHLYLAFIAPKFAPSNGFGSVRADFRILSERKVGDDIMAWMKLEE